MRRFHQLTAADRILIGKYRARRLSLTDIAIACGFSKSTVSRELNRNRRPNGVYQSRAAQFIRNARNHRAMRKRRGTIRAATIKWITLKLREKWSPEQVAGRSKIDGPQSVSHEYIYQLIKADQATGGNLFTCLRRSGRRKYRSHRLGKRVKLLNRVDISTRPKIIEKRIRLGDLEGDLIVGRHQLSHIAVVADRVSRLVGIERVHSKGNGQVNGPLKRAIKRNGKGKTLTLDNGLEFSHHERLRKETGLAIYFAHAYSAWERGTVENMNRLLRQYLPKKTDFRKITSEQLREIETSLNNRPRKCLKYRTPNERHFGLRLDRIRN